MRGGAELTKQVGDLGRIGVDGTANHGDAYHDGPPSPVTLASLSPGIEERCGKQRTPMDHSPRHFHANERFFIEVAFETPLPEGAVPAAEFAGPLGPGGPALT